MKYFNFNILEANVVRPDLAIKDLQEEYLGSSKSVIFWNLNQWMILHSNIQKLLFLADFGAGGFLANIIKPEMLAPSRGSQV